MKTVQVQIAERLKELVCPPNGIQVTGGKQSSKGNSYRNVKNIDLVKHVTGKITYAIDVAYKDGSGIDACKWGVLDIDESGEEGFKKTLTIKEFLDQKGVSSGISFSGKKGFHVYIFTEPVPL